MSHSVPHIYSQCTSNVLAGASVGNNKSAHGAGNNRLQMQNQNAMVTAYSDLSVKYTQKSLNIYKPHSLALASFVRKSET